MLGSHYATETEMYHQLFGFLRQSHVGQNSLEPVLLRPQLPKGWDDRLVLPHLTKSYFKIS